MYGAKADGRGTYRFFEAGMDARMKARRALEIDLRQAVMCGEFELHYQPLVNIRDNEIVGLRGAAALASSRRAAWSRRPSSFRSRKRPASSIRSASGCCERPARRRRSWPDNITVTVNVSPVQFKNDNLVQMVVSALAASGLPAQRLELEITESVLLHDNEATLATLHQLQEAWRADRDGRLRHRLFVAELPAAVSVRQDQDRSLVHQGCRRKRMARWSIVQAVVSIAKSRNIATTAEGVETDEQLELLRALGCTEMQGYLFSRPKPPLKSSTAAAAAREAIGGLGVTFD